jgi:hypothetical protein
MVLQEADQSLVSFPIQPVKQFFYSVIPDAQECFAAYLFVGSLFQNADNIFG